MPSRFRHFAAIDWSGAKGSRHKGIAVALAGAGNAAPALVRRGSAWSRQEVLDWLAGYFMDQDWSFKPVHRLIML